MFHCAAFTVNIGTTADTDVPAVVDDVLLIQNNHFVPQQDMQLLWAAAGSATISRARLNSPTLRLITLPFIRPVYIGAVPGDTRNVADYRPNPFRVRGLEELSAQATSGVAMTERLNILIGLQDRFDPVPAGDIYTMRGTSTTTSTANAWTTLTTTWADNLPTGRYAIVGLSGFAATAVAFRLIVPGYAWRPGAICGDSAGDQINEMFLKGGLGVWGYFNSWAMPLVQTLNNAAVATHEYYLDLIRIS